MDYRKITDMWGLNQLIKTPSNPHKSLAIGETETHKSIQLSLATATVNGVIKSPLQPSIGSSEFDLTQADGGRKNINPELLPAFGYMGEALGEY